MGKKEEPKGPSPAEIAAQIEARKKRQRDQERRKQAEGRRASVASPPQDTANMRGGISRSRLRKDLFTLGAPTGAGISIRGRN